MKTALNYNILKDEVLKEKEAATALSQQATATNAVANTMARNQQPVMMAMPQGSGFGNTRR